MGGWRGAAGFALFNVMRRPTEAGVAVLLSICALLAPVLAWEPGRAAVYVGYLDMASDALHFGPRSLVDLYWSPLYPTLLAGWLGVFRPSPPRRSPA